MVMGVVNKLVAVCSQAAKISFNSEMISRPVFPLRSPNKTRIEWSERPCSGAGFTFASAQIVGLRSNILDQRVGNLACA